MGLVTLYLVLGLFVAGHPELISATIECHSVECVKSVISLAPSSDAYRVRIYGVKPSYWGYDIVDLPIADFQLNP